MKDKNMEILEKVEDELFIHNESENSVYYGVHIPNDFQSINLSSNPNVFVDKNSVLQLLKQHKRARFKAFSLFHEAVDFAINGSENPNNNSTIDYSTTQKSVVETQVLGEKPSPFKGPKPQELVILRKAIEKGDYESVDKIVWRNPRYLISNGDTPSILQEGSRYNALHIAAKAKHSKLAELILDTVSNVEFVKLLYGDDDIENGKERAKVFTDLYLNTPDKGLNETPLHFAVKYGAAEVVEVLVSYPQCDKTLMNKFGQTPKMMICARCDKSDNVLYKRIEQLLQEIYYVPVLRAEDNSIPPKVGEPFSPGNPPVFNTHPSSPRLEIQAYAGPMNKEGAEHFRKVWKTPPRSLKFNTPTKKLDNSMGSVSSLKYKDPLKGLEIVGKTLASQYDISWKEYWSFLDNFVDITSEEGLNLLENHLKSRILETSRTITSVGSDNSTSDRNYSNVSSISELCHAFQAIHLNSSNSSSDSHQDEVDSKFSNNLSPFLCLEKACQVFAHRFANNIKNAVNGNLINILDSEIKQLEIVILSYMDDERFANINFSCFHYRLSYLVAQKLFVICDEETEIVGVYRKIVSLTEICSKSLDCFSSDDEGVNSKDLPIKKGTSIRKQLLCLAYFILSLLNQKLEAQCDNLTEQDCITIWENLTPCACILNARKSRRNLNLQRNNSRKHYAGNLSESVKRLFQPEKEESDDIECDLNESYFTPVSTPEVSEDEDEDYDDAKTLDLYEVFIDGKYPSKTDGTVFNALIYTGCDIDKDKYPNIYLWRHKISQFSEEERNSWRKQNYDESLISSPPNITSTPQKTAAFVNSPSRSWLRITGVNSPKSTKKLSFSNGI